MAKIPDPSYTVPGDPITSAWANNLVGAIKQKNKTTKKLPLKGGGPSRPPCPFGEIIIDQQIQKIRGGVVFCGDKVFNVAPFDINTSLTREVFMYIELPVTAQKDDDNQLLLPGVKTSSGNPTFKENATNYPNITAPTLPSGNGIIIIPLGKLKVENQNGTFAPVDCGNITVEHCAGSLTHTRSSNL